MNGVLVKCEPTVGGFRFILTLCMADAFYNNLELDNCVEEYANGFCELWSVPDVGFIVISLHRDDGITTLDVNYAAGKGLYHPDNMEALYKLARGYGAEIITCSTLKRGNARLLQRAGYIVDRVERGRTYLIRTVPDGRKQEQ